MNYREKKRETMTFIIIKCGKTNWKCGKIAGIFLLYRTMRKMEKKLYFGFWLKNEYNFALLIKLMLQNEVQQLLGSR